MLPAPEGAVVITGAKGLALDAIGSIQREAFEGLEAAIRAVDPSQLKPTNIDGYYAASIVVSAGPRFKALRPRMERLGHELDLWLIDHCVPLAHAYCYACAEYVERDTTAHELRLLRNEGLTLRTRLHKAVKYLSEFGVAPGVHVTPLRNRPGYRDVAHDLTSLVRVFRDRWELVADKTFIGEHELARASVIATRLVEGCATRRDRSEQHERATLVCKQAFTLMLEAYAEVRRAVAFLRAKDGDAEQIAPSLYAGRNSGGRLTRQAREQSA